ncbi:bifunctional DNA-binding transcriptional regulator/O6-methylguanine-DNA methyltransferase Ada [Pseudomonas folii]|uniref:Bifunctional DNA-binding transcriptional regulator/O6-methylguanine-DNA methyltransferase Ada n=1 Tax=Pseudomonas folii TaxID=2762593 RepID=A0ABR7AV88_9PSED|nr:bifunctional DNA-binding transcriptional regulator/O6-methylguanine-DNA methyltransferase Ada [Pseudomonas folii]MBC3948842.1 bifunctional DNA-binding transcriptional regulator/O6-methylguanine-DNA methyltransferase Ada [Pseudomonas folii]
MTRNRSPSSSAENDPRWLSVLARDAAADGQFVYGVRTTGVYCRPSSLSRLPNPGNVVFFDSAEQAEAAGYRPSKRIATDQSHVAQQHAALVASACRCIEQAESAPSLKALAQNAGLSPYHFHRVFKTVTGLTPKAYADAHRAKKIRQQLASGGSITDALYDAGFNSSSRFYAASDALLGMKPAQYRQGGHDTEIRFAIGECSLGSILVAQSQRGVCAILLGDDPEVLVRDFQDQFRHATLVGADDDFEQMIARVVGFIESPNLGLDLPLDMRGTAFQQRVWLALKDIPPGSTASYAQIAQRIGAPKSFRAVAMACGANRLAVAIPCHRVVRSDGGLSGYRWGVERKQQLLDREIELAKLP